MAPAKSKKRSNASDSRRLSTSKKRRYTKPTVTSDNGPEPFPFLDLLPELRNNVYDHIVAQITEDSSLVLRLSSKGALTSTFALCQVNRQIRKELLLYAFKFTNKIVTIVRNWNFSHVVTFLNRLSEEDHARFLAGEQKLIVELAFHKEDAADPSGLQRWCQRFDNARKRGRGYQTEYQVTDSELRRNYSGIYRNWFAVVSRGLRIAGHEGWRVCSRILDTMIDRRRQYTEAYGIPSDS